MLKLILTNLPFGQGEMFDEADWQTIIGVAWQRYIMPSIEASC
jgi:hypothetical protein